MSTAAPPERIRREVKIRRQGFRRPQSPYLTEGGSRLKIAEASDRQIDINASDGTRRPLKIPKAAAADSYFSFKSCAAAG